MALWWEDRTKWTRTVAFQHCDPQGPSHFRPVLKRPWWGGKECDIIDSDHNVIEWILCVCRFLIWWKGPVNTQSPHHHHHHCLTQHVFLTGRKPLTVPISCPITGRFQTKEGSGSFIFFRTDKKKKNQTERESKINHKLFRCVGASPCCLLCSF